MKIVRQPEIVVANVWFCYIICLLYKHCPLAADLPCMTVFDAISASASLSSSVSGKYSTALQSNKCNSNCDNGASRRLHWRPMLCRY